MATAAPQPVVRAGASSRSRRLVLVLAVGWIAALVLLALLADVLPLPGTDKPVGAARTAARD